MEQGMREGSANGRAKLNWTKVADIRHRYETTGCSQLDLAIDFDLAQSTVWAILKNQTWKVPEKGDGHGRHDQALG